MVMRCWLVLIFIFCMFDSQAQTSLSGYTFGPGDSLKISVYQEPDLSVTAEISQQGIVDMPLLGSVKLAGLTQQEAKKLLEEKLRDGYLVAPSVSITVNTYRPFFIYGEVRNPGSYPYQPDITIEQAIALAGGLLDRASRKEWHLQRGSEKDTSAASADTVLMPGDVIKIDKSFF
jgi:polysaccharide export outer membrane protein